MKNQNGTSHLLLVLVTIIMIIAIVFTTKTILKENFNMEVEDLKTDMLILQGKIKIVAQENAMNKEQHQLVGKKLMDNLENEKVKILLEKQIINQDETNFEKYYIIDNEAMNELDIKISLNENFFIVSYDNYEIIYSEGIQIGKIKYYKLSDILNLELFDYDNSISNNKTVNNID